MKALLKRIPFIKWILDIRKELAIARFELSRTTRIQQQIYREILVRERREMGCAFPSAFEQQTFSQNGEDGIIQEICKRLEIKNGFFVELGTGDGSENNTRLLLESDWKGIWIDGDSNCCKTAEKNLVKFIADQRLRIYHEHIDAENANNVLGAKNIPHQLDMLSIDLDLNTHHVWESIDCINPRVLIIEYNGFFPQGMEWSAEYEPKKYWDGTINMGASLEYIVKISKTKGYELIGCDLTGTNAFLVQSEDYLKYFNSSSSNHFPYENARPFLVNDPEHRRI
jgi:hypothetical protein